MRAINNIMVSSAQAQATSTASEGNTTRDDFAVAGTASVGLPQRSGPGLARPSGVQAPKKIDQYYLDISEHLNAAALEGWNSSPQSIPRSLNKNPQQEIRSMRLSYAAAAVIQVLKGVYDRSQWFSSVSGELAFALRLQRAIGAWGFLSNMFLIRPEVLEASAPNTWPMKLNGLAGSKARYRR